MRKNIVLLSILLSILGFSCAKYDLDQMFEKEKKPEISELKGLSIVLCALNEEDELYFALENKPYLLKYDGETTEYIDIPERMYGDQKDIFFDKEGDLLSIHETKLFKYDGEKPKLLLSHSVWKYNDGITVDEENNIYTWDENGYLGDPYIYKFTGSEWKDIKLPKRNAFYGSFRGTISGNQFWYQIDKESLEYYSGTGYSSHDIPLPEATYENYVIKVFNELIYIKYTQDYDSDGIDDTRIYYLEKVTDNFFNPVLAFEILSVTNEYSSGNTEFIIDKSEDLWMVGDEQVLFYSKGGNSIQYNVGANIELTNLHLYLSPTNNIWASYEDQMYKFEKSQFVKKEIIK